VNIRNGVTPAKLPIGEGEATPAMQGKDGIRS